MKASEVRIGNLLNHNNGFVVGPFTINSIHISDLERDNAYAKEYEPILLTEEWLISFGFKFKSYGYSEEEWKQWNFNGYYLNGFRCTTSGVELEYVHQLQNLYFALTGEELGFQSLLIYI